jgi:hypothetical protein
MPAKSKDQLQKAAIRAKRYRDKKKQAKLNVLPQSIINQIDPVNLNEIVDVASEKIIDGYTHKEAVKEAIKEVQHPSKCKNGKQLLTVKKCMYSPKQIRERANAQADVLQGEIDAAIHQELEGKGLIYGGSAYSDAIAYIKNNKKKIALAIASAAAVAAVKGLTYYRKHHGPLARFVREGFDPDFQY